MRLTMAQALVRFLTNQYVERDGKETRFFGGVWGIFGHGNLAGIGQALQQEKGLPYYLPRNEQAMVHIAAAFAKASNRLRTFACTSSIGPGATNMVTGAAAATINRVPVLLLPGDIFARRNVAPVLQQLEQPYSQDMSVNDVFKPVSKYWDRINRPDQLPFALLEAMRVLTSPADTGAVTLALPQDVQAESWDYPVEFFRKRVWHIQRTLADRELLKRAAELIKKSKKPLIIAGGGVIYSEATQILSQLATKTGTPVCETQAGKGSLSYDHPQNAGAIGATGALPANVLAKEADLIIAIGTRLGDFPTASKTAFQNPNVKFIHINVAEMDVQKMGALPVIADAKVTLEELLRQLSRFRVSGSYAKKIQRLKKEWEKEVNRLFNLKYGSPVAQSEVIGAVNTFSGPRDVVVCAAGSLPGDLHKLWRTRDPKGYHLEYGYSCMGYEIAGGLGVKMADPSREVYVMVGDGSYLMMSSEIATTIQEGHKVNIIVLDNHGYSSIGGLSQSLGSEGFGTRYRFRNPETGELDGPVFPVDFVENAKSFGAYAVRAVTLDDLHSALAQAKKIRHTCVIVMEVDREQRVPGYATWWDVPVAEVSEMKSVKQAGKAYQQGLKKERFFF